MSLKQCTVFWGGVEVRPGYPLLTEARDVYALPFAHQAPWGVFDASGHAVESCVDRWFTTNAVHWGQVLETDPQMLAEITESLPDEELILGGRANGHFGHFIMETLPRLWPLPHYELSSRKIVLFGLDHPEQVFQWPFVREFYGALGISEKNIICINRPVRIPHLLVPGPSLQPQAFGYRVFTDLCQEIGARLLRDPPPMDDRPVFLSKAKLQEGIGRGNETCFLEAAEKAGYEIVFPDQLTVAEKLAVFASRPNIAGVAMSGMWMTVFTPTKAKFCVLSPDEYPNSGFRLMNAVKHQEDRYYWPEGTTHQPSQRPGFLGEILYGSPEQSAKEYIAMAEEMFSAGGG